MLGELIPIGGGDPIPLLKESLVVGRRETCDIVLRWPNVSGQHCKLTLESGYWFVEDLGSSNGVKVNGARVSRKRIDPGDSFGVGKHTYELHYNPSDLGATGAPPSDDQDYDQIMGKSLLERAGLTRKNLPPDRRFNVNDGTAGQFKKNRE